MKKVVFLLTLLFTLAASYAQQAPSGMKYQAVARNPKGEVLGGEAISVKISLTSKGNSGRAVHYTEVHEVLTSDLGLFTLVIGEGKAVLNKFNQVPWSTEDVWMEISLKHKSNDYALVSNSKLLAVPYAFHAATASELVNKNSVPTAQANVGSAGVPSQVWSLKGNSRTDAATDRMGTTDFADLVFITNNLERLRITANGDINLKNKLDVGTDLTVKGNVALNTVYGTTTINGAATLKNTLTVDGETALNKSLSVNNESATNLSGVLNVNKDAALKAGLTVTGAANLNSTLNVNNGAATVLSGALSVTKNTVLGEDVNVKKNTDLDGALNVDGKSRFRDSVQFDKTVEIGGAVKSSTLNVSGNEGAHVATIENKNNGDGDGLMIKLGKTNPMWDGAAYIQISVPTTQGVQTQVDQIRDWAYGRDDFDAMDLLNLVPAQYMVGTVANITNYVTEQINAKIGLPISLGPYSTPSQKIWDATTIFGGLDLGLLGSIPKLEIPALTIPSVPVFPAVVAVPAIPRIPVSGLPTLDFPNLRGTNVTNSLTKKNEFITFADKDGRTLGAIRAQSIEDFSYDYFDGLKLLQLADQMIGIDLLKDLMGVLAGTSEIATDFNNIGVEYSSGHGDYAEWLERENNNEAISAGDIVGVRAGKISKNLVGAEQIMAVSHKPIVLGNMPEKEKISLGNNIAFMGQIPVKVMGPVKAGDYIVAKGEVAGYGVAISPKDMQVQDYKLAVGRSWTTNEHQGPKLVNTVVGVHNNDFLNIVGGLQRKVEQNERRLQALEQRMYVAPVKKKTAVKTF